MTRFVAILGLLTALSLGQVRADDAPPVAAVAAAVTPVETPFFEADVAAGKLPPVADRLPKAPRLIDLKAMGREIGEPGGTWRMLMGDQRDLRMMTVYSYTRLVVFDDKLHLVPDILQSLDNQDDKVFTLHLREGHKWSDGQPFTAEDFRYYWDDVANNPKLSPSGPNFHRVDTAGHQLPYFDHATLTLGTTNLIPAKVAAGEADLQARYLNFEDYTFLKAGERKNDYTARLWELGEGAFAALYPNLTAKDPVWRGLMRDVRFRRALSLGINRHDINNVIFFGLARESGDTVLPQSPLYKPSFATDYTEFDVAKANALLDEAGLAQRDSDGTRLLPDGRRAEITVETSGENQLFTDILELVSGDWAKLGLRTFAHPSHLDIFRQRIASGDTIMSIDRGIDNAVPTAEFEPSDLAPTTDAQYQWPRWGLYTQSSGHEGEAIDLPEAKALLDLYHDWRHSSNADQQREVWTKMLDINADQVFSIGIVNGTRQPVVISKRMRNVPEAGLFAFEPGSFFGIYMPDTFFYADKPKS